MGTDLKMVNGALNIPTQQLTISMRFTHAPAGSGKYGVRK